MKYLIRYERYPQYYHVEKLMTFYIVLAVKFFLDKESHDWMHSPWSIFEKSINSKIISFSSFNKFLMQPIRTLSQNTDAALINDKINVKDKDGLKYSRVTYIKRLATVHGGVKLVSSVNEDFRKLRRKTRKRRSEMNEDPT